MILISSVRSFVIDFISIAHAAFIWAHSFLAASPSALDMKVATLSLKAYAFLSCISILILNYFTLPIHSPRVYILSTFYYFISRAFSNWSMSVDPVRSSTSEN